MAAGLATLNVNVNTNASQAANALAALEAAASRAEQAFTRMTTSAARVVTAHNNVRQSTGALAAQMTNLQAQMFDIATTLQQAGPFNVLMQQGPQVYQALNGPGGVAQGIRNVRDALIAAVTPGRVLGAALVGAAGVALVAWNRYGDAQREITRTLEGQGRGFGLTATAFESMAQRMAAAGDLSVSTARNFANTLARTGGGISPDTVERLAKASKDFAATYTGGDIQAGITKMTTLIASGAEGIATWGKRQDIYNSKQREAIAEAVRLGDVNLAVGITLDALQNKLAKHSETTGPVVKAWQDISKSISDIINAFGPYVDRFATATAGVFQLAARGAETIASGNISESAPAKGLRKVQNFIETGNTNESYQSGKIDQVHADNTAAAEKAATANDKLATSLKEVAEAQRNGASSTQENSTQLRDQQDILLDTQKRLRDAYNAEGTTFNEQSSITDKLVKVREALDSTDVSVKKNAISFAGLSNAEVQAARSTDERVAAAKSEETARNRLGGVIEENTDKIVRERTGYKDLEAQTKQFDKATENRIELTKDEAEARDRASHALKSQQNADGTRITQQQKAQEQDSIALDQLKARTQEERISVAQRQLLAQQRGQDITQEQALQQQLAQTTRLREEDRMKIVDMVRDQGFEAERLKVERDLLFASADARARVIAKLEQEQALRRQGIPTTGPDAQRLFTDAANNASNKLFNETIEKGANDAKRAVSDFASSFATDMAHGVKAAEALVNALKKVGDALISGGVKSVVEGVATQNWAQAGIGAAEAGVGFLLNAFGPSEKSKQRKQQMMDAWEKSQQDEFDEIQKQQQAVIDAGIASAKASQQAAEEATRQAEDATRRIESFQDRAFFAGLDTSTPSGQLAAFDRQAQRAREEEVRNGGQAIVDLEIALAAERERIVSDSVDTMIAESQRLFDEAQQFLGQFARSIQQFLDNLSAGSGTALSPSDRLSAAQGQFDTQLSLGQSGDREALSGLTGYASNLLDAAKAFYGSTTGYQSILGTVTSQLATLPSQISPEQLIVNAIQSQTNTLSDVFSSLDINNDGVISQQEATNTWLASLFDEIDVNGDGQIDRLELIKYATQGTENSNSYIQGNTDVSNQILAAQQTLLTAIATNTDQLATIQGQLQTIFNTTAKTSNNAARTAYNTMFSANSDVGSAVGLVGDFTYARGGWVRGAGTGTSDSIQARLSNGEFVVRAAQARAYAPQLEAINNGRAMNDNSALTGEVRALRAELARLRSDVQNVTRATVASAQHVREGVDDVRDSHNALVREQKRRAA